MFPLDFLMALSLVSKVSSNNLRWKIQDGYPENIQPWQFTPSELEKMYSFHAGPKTEPSSNDRIYPIAVFTGENSEISLTCIVTNYSVGQSDPTWDYGQHSSWTGPTRTTFLKQVGNITKVVDEERNVAMFTIVLGITNRAYNWQVCSCSSPYDFAHLNLI